jgi:hypothetical protein
MDKILAKLKSVSQKAQGKVADWFSPVPDKVRPRDVVREIPGSIKKVTNAVSDFIAPPRQKIIDEIKLENPNLQGIDLMRKVEDVEAKEYMLFPFESATISEALGQEPMTMEKFLTVKRTDPTMGVGSLKSVAKRGAEKAKPLIKKGVDKVVEIIKKEASKYKKPEEFVQAMKTKDWSKSMDQNEFFEFGNNFREAVRTSDPNLDVEKYLTNLWADNTSKISKEMPVKETYKETGDLTTKILKDLEGKYTVSNLYILDATNRGELKQTERDLIRNLAGGEGDTIVVKDFAEKVKAELLPLTRNSSENFRVKIKELEKKIESKGFILDEDLDGSVSIVDKNGEYIDYDELPDDVRDLFDRYGSLAEEGQGKPKQVGFEQVSLPGELRGPVANYSEVIYESPIKTKAGDTHFPARKAKGYFGHTRIEDMADNQTRRVIEVQSDLYQKGNLEKEINVKPKNYPSAPIGPAKEGTKRYKEVSKLQQYNDPTAHFRMIREEIKKAAQDGKTKLQFPTGETAMKIEGLGEYSGTWKVVTPLGDEVGLLASNGSNMKVGMQIKDQAKIDWIITDVVGDGKFKAMQKRYFDEMVDKELKTPEQILKEAKTDDSLTESFDISGKVDTNNPIYKFYEKEVQKYLNKFGGKKVVDDRGVSWVEVPITKGMAQAPVEAFGAIGGVETDEEGKLSFSPEKAAAGVAVMGSLQGKGPKRIGDILKKEGDKIVDGVKTTMGDMFQGGAERRFITRTKKLEPGTQQFLDGKYKPKSNEELIQKADELIRTDKQKAMELATTGVGDNAVATASRLIDDYVMQGRNSTDEFAKNEAFEKAADIANTIAEKLTEYGRAIQAASILGKLTPEGMVRWAAKKIQKHNEAVKMDKSVSNILKGRQRGIDKALKEVPELTGKEVEDIIKRMDDIQLMPEGVEKAMEINKLMQEVSDKIPSSMRAKVVSLWKAGLLTGPNTHLLNVGSNSAFNATEILKDVPGAIVDSIVSLFTGKRALVSSIEGQASGMREGVAKGWRYWKTGFDERNSLDKLDYKNVNFGTGKLARGIKKYEQAVFRALGTVDQPFYYGAKMRSLYNQAQAIAKNQKIPRGERSKFIKDLVMNPTEDMMKYSVLDAETAVFQNRTQLGDLARVIQRSGGGAGEFIVPFGKTPSAVATQVWNYSPLGVVQTLIKTAMKGKKGFDQRLFSQAMGRGLLGSVPLMYIGRKLYENEQISLAWPTSEKEREQWRLEGRRPNTIFVGGKWRSPIILGPGGLSIVAGAYLERGLKETGSPLGAMATLAASMGNIMTEQSFLQGINSTIDAIKDPERSFKGWATNFIGSFIPTLMANVARSTDDRERRVDGPIERIKSRVPGLRNKLEPQVSSLGKQVETPPASTVLFDASRPGEAQASQTDPLVKELRRLMDEGYASTPTKLGTNAGYKTVTPEQNTKLLEVTGKEVRKAVQEVMESSAYRTYDDEMKGQAIDKATQEAKVKSRAEFLVWVMKGKNEEEQKRILSGLKEENFLTKQVFNMYLSIK